MERHKHNAYDFLMKYRVGLYKKPNAPKNPESTNRGYRYMVHVHTGDKMWAGTNANVKINMIGLKSQTGPTFLRCARHPRARNPKPTHQPRFSNHAFF